MLSLRYVVIGLIALSLSHASAFSPLFSVRATSSTKQLSQSPVWRILRGGEQQEYVESPEENGETLQEKPATFQEKPATVAAIIPKFSGITTALAFAGKIYCQQLEQRPIITKSYTAGFIFGLSDLLAQRIARSSEKEESSLDWTRLIATTLVGLLYFGPAAHYWYDMIFKLLPGTGLLSTLYKAFWGQVIFGPSFTCIFFATSLLQAGTFSLGSWAEKIRKDLPGAWLAGAGFWPLVDVISYSVIPMKWIPLFVNMCSFVWTIYLSLVANKSSKKSS
jgi:protein Mpv17